MSVIFKFVYPPARQFEYTQPYNISFHVGDLVIIEPAKDGQLKMAFEVTSVQHRLLYEDGAGQYGRWRTEVWLKSATVTDDGRVVT